LALKDGYKDNQIKGFKRTHFPWLYEIPARSCRQDQGGAHWCLICTQAVEAHVELRTRAQRGSDGSRHKGKLPVSTHSRHLIGIASIWRCRITSNCAAGAICGWTVPKLIEFCDGRQDWYTLLHPGSGTERDSTIADIRKQQDILIRLLHGLHRPLLQVPEDRL
jgi:hypothetical protein